jgi:hypothetical protein
MSMAWGLLLVWVEVEAGVAVLLGLEFMRAG